MVVNINGNSVSLATAEGIDAAVEDMVGVEMNPGMLLTQLQSYGCNLLASDDDLVECEKTCGLMKNMDLENDVYLQMSQCASALEFCSSTWNKELSPSQVGLLARESTVYNAVDESFDYECISAEMDKISQRTSGPQTWERSKGPERPMPSSRMWLAISMGRVLALTTA